MKKYLMIFLVLSMVTLASAQLEILGNDNDKVIDLASDVEVITFDNNTGFVNASNFWVTNIGTLSGVNDTQHDEVGGLLTISISWLASFGNNLWCELTGCTMTGDLWIQNDGSFRMGNATSYWEWFQGQAPTGQELNIRYVKDGVQSYDEDILWNSLFKAQRGIDMGDSGKLRFYDGIGADLFWIDDFPRMMFNWTDPLDGRWHFTDSGKTSLLEGDWNVSQNFSAQYICDSFGNCLDNVEGGNSSWNQTTAEDLFIEKDGSTTTTANIPFAEGITVPENKVINIGDNGGAEGLLRWDSAENRLELTISEDPNTYFDSNGNTMFQSLTMSGSTPIQFNSASNSIKGDASYLNYTAPAHNFVSTAEAVNAFRFYDELGGTTFIQGDADAQKIHMMNSLVEITESNFGIGVTPSYPLHVVGTSYLDGFVNNTDGINSTGLICDSTGCIGSGGGNSSWNQSLADALYADISVTGMDYTNVAMENESNVFIGENRFTSDHVYLNGTDKSLIIGDEGGVYDSANRLIIIDSHPGIRLEVVRPSGGAAFSFFDLYGTDSDVGVPEKWGAIGVYGTMNVDPPEMRYLYFGAHKNTAYDNNTLKIRPDNTVGIGLDGTDYPEATLHVNGNVILDGFVNNTGGINSTGEICSNGGTICIGDSVMDYTNVAMINKTNTFEESQIIGDGSAGVDYELTFDGETNDGKIKWREDENNFYFDKPVGIGADKTWNHALWIKGFGGDLLRAYDGTAMRTQISKLGTQNWFLSDIGRISYTTPGGSTGAILIANFSGGFRNDMVGFKTGGLGFYSSSDNSQGDLGLKINTDANVYIGNLTTGGNAGSDVCIDANNNLCACGSCA